MSIRKYKIFHIIRSLDQGGLENGVVNLVNRMNGDVFENIICCLHHSGEFERRLIKSIKVEIIGKRKGNDWKAIHRLRKLLKKHSPTVVHTRNWAGFDGVLAARWAGVPIIVHSEHGFEQYDISRQPVKRRIIRHIVLKHLVNRLICVSGSLKERLINELAISQHKIIHVPNGVDTKKFSNEKRKKLKSQNIIKQDTFVIGIVARLDPIKNHQIALAAFKRLCDNHSNLMMLFIGDGPEKSNLMELTDRLNLNKKVYFMGKRHDVARLYPIIDVFLLPSLSEGMSNTILEAMASGVAVIASAVGGNRELVIDNETGFLFELTSAEDLEKKIGCYLENPELVEQHGRRGRKRVIENFTLSDMVKRYESIYLEIIHEKVNSKGMRATKSNFLKT